jgi:hypothetical protein
MIKILALFCYKIKNVITIFIFYFRRISSAALHIRQIRGRGGGTFEHILFTFDYTLYP